MRVHVITAPRTGQGMGPPGSIYFSRWALRILRKSVLAAKYFALPEPRRLPIIVVFPCGGPRGTWWCVDGKQRRDGQWLEPGWDVDVARGLESITLVPSIDFKELWHGFLTNGEISP